MWEVTKKDGSVISIDSDNQLIIYLNNVNNYYDFTEILKLIRIAPETQNCD